MVCVGVVCLFYLSFPSPPSLSFGFLIYLFSVSLKYNTFNNIQLINALQLKILHLCGVFIYHTIDARRGQTVRKSHEDRRRPAQLISNLADNLNRSLLNLLLLKYCAAINVHTNIIFKRVPFVWLKLIWQLGQNETNMIRINWMVLINFFTHTRRVRLPPVLF